MQYRREITRILGSLSLLTLTAMMSACASKSDEMSMIHFKFDQANLDSQARQTAKLNGEEMKKNQSAKMIIEGHCDERGTNEYNIALGEKRAKVVKDYMKDLGISSRRLETKSWGEERPLASGNSEKIFSKNRRAEFVALESDKNSN